METEKENSETAKQVRDFNQWSWGASLVVCFGPLQYCICWALGKRWSKIHLKHFVEGRPVNVFASASLEICSNCIGTLKCKSSWSRSSSLSACLTVPSAVVTSSSFSSLAKRSLTLRFFGDGLLRKSLSQMCPPIQVQDWSYHSILSRLVSSTIQLNLGLLATYGISILLREISQPVSWEITCCYHKIQHNNARVSAW